MFLTKVMLRTDCREPYWIERFIAGLQCLFAEKIRNNLREKYNNQIRYKDLTYGEIISYINKEGLTMCSNQRQNAKLKKDKITGKNELGDFYEQYSYVFSRADSYSKNNQMRPLNLFFNYSGNSSGNDHHKKGNNFFVPNSNVIKNNAFKHNSCVKPGMVYS